MLSVSVKSKQRPELNMIGAHSQKGSDNINKHNNKYHINMSLVTTLDRFTHLILKNMLYKFKDVDEDQSSFSLVKHNLSLNFNIQYYKQMFNVFSINCQLCSLPSSTVQFQISESCYSEIAQEIFPISSFAGPQGGVCSPPGGEQSQSPFFLPQSPVSSPDPSR